jgi:hypothetical protein
LPLSDKEKSLSLGAEKRGEAVPEARLLPGSAQPFGLNDGFKLA